MGRTTLNARAIKAIEELALLNYPVVFGGDKDDDDDNKGGSGSGKDDADDDEDDDDNKGGKSLAEKLEGVTDPNARRLIEVSDESKRRKEKIRSLQADRDELQAKIDAAERKKKSDLENATKDLTDRDTRIANMEKTLRKNLLETAILRDNDTVWHDPAMVIAALNMDEIEIDVDTGKVEGVDAELRRVAKDKPFLVASSKKSSKKDDSTLDKGKTGSTGSTPGASGGGVGGENVLKERSTLIEKYPVLGQR